MKSWMTLLSFMLSMLACATAEDTAWPRDVAIPSGSITVYQPQVESLKEDVVTARAALAFTKKGEKAPVFGVCWLEGKISVDRQAGTVTYREIEVTKVRFPEELENVGDELLAVVKKAEPHAPLHGTIEELKTSLAAAGAERDAASLMKTDPPTILYRDSPAILVQLDGDPVLHEMDAIPYKLVANSAYPMFADHKERTWFLCVADGVWHSSNESTGPWRRAKIVPRELSAVVEQQREQFMKSAGTQKASEAAASSDVEPEIIVATKPTELFVSEGKTDFKPVTDKLLRMDNSDTSIFMEVDGQQLYVVMSGRWYTAKSMDGPWVFVASDELPETFREIPADSAVGDVRAYVAGTDEAVEAVMDAQIPQTATVQRGRVEIEVQYDGSPRFENVEGTELEFAVNASRTVLRSGKTYYLIADAVWYISQGPTGPWDVSDHAPPGIKNTHPSSPVYNTKFVYVYDSTPEVVYVGYTPGYTCSYVYGPTIIYGTGWVYRPWISRRYYYPRYRTWGYHLSYNSVTGWGVRMSWSSGPYRVGWYSAGGVHGGTRVRHSWWGPGGYRPATSPRNPTYYQANVGGATGVTDAWKSSNLYARRGQVATVSSATGVQRPARPEPRPIERPSTQPVGIPSTRPNNVYADKKGNVYRYNNGAWEIRGNDNWNAHNPNRPQTRPAQPQRPQTRPAQPQVPQTRPAQPQTRPMQPQTRPGNPQTLPQTRPAQPQTRPVYPQTRPQTLPQTLPQTSPNISRKK